MTANDSNNPDRKSRQDTYSILSTLSFCVASADGSILAPLYADAEPTTLGAETSIQDRYRIMGELGRGGMGCVYLAKDDRLNRLVAIKVVAGPAAVQHRVLEDALAHEARLGAGLNHPAIAAVYDFGYHQGHAFTVFEYVDGDSLRELLRNRGRLPLDEVRAIIGALARALDFAHSRGIVHRDLKPENIRASKQGQFKILDLGLAQEFRRTRDWATFAGTPAYASPEQAAGLPSDGRADQYALAVIAYELLIGSRPFEHDNAWELLQLHRLHPPPPPSSRVTDLPGVVCASIVRALNKDPQRRFASCEEFAAAMGSPEQWDDRHRVIVSQREGDRCNVYICHAGENSPMARQLAQALEGEGYSCWYYEHDALPGISYVTQTLTAIKQSDAVVLMVSDESIGSPEVGREVQEAYQLGRPFLPLLLGMRQQEFRQRQPDWQPMIGPAAVIDLTAGNLSSAVSRLIRTLELWGIPRRPRRAATPPHPASGPAHAGSTPARGPAGFRKIWASDANQIEIYDLNAVVFRNAAVDDFLERRNKFFLSAGKGLGKTLLLTFKRSLLASSLSPPSGASSSAGVMFVPQGRPYLDFMSDVRSLSKQHDQLISDLLNTKRMWNLALSLSALSHQTSLITQDDQDEIRRFPRRMQSWLLGSSVEPTVVFKELLGQTVRAINRLIDDSENFLDYKVRQIHSGMFFFVDKVDQALRQLSQAAWIHVQAGLIEAAWDMMNANSHVKIYASIRQEAFSNYESDIKSNLFGAATLIRYSEDELHQMLDQLARCYEGCDSFQDFITLNVVRHPRRPFPEDSFRYVRRHTLGRPRDLVIVASELSAKRNTMNETSFRHLVNETSARGLVPNVFDEMRVFLNCLLEKQERQRFFALIPHNILTGDEAIRICCLFNGLPEDDREYFRANADGLYHPFCDLYRVGLLGIVAREPDGSRMLQKFRQPHDFITDLQSSLPDSPYYLVHPAMDDHIGQLHTSEPYGLFQHVSVGDGQTWETYFDLFCNLERCLFRITDTPLHDAVYQLLNDARIILASDRKPHLRSILEASPHLRLSRDKCADLGYEDLYYWLEELVEYGDG